MKDWERDTEIHIIKDKLASIHNCYVECVNRCKELRKETLEHVQSLVDQIPNAVSGPLIPHTPRVPKKRDVKRIQTIPENDVINNDSVKSIAVAEETQNIDQTYDEVSSTRSRRAASQKAAENIKVQQSIGLMTKLRRPSSGDETLKNQIKTVPRVGRPKRAKTVTESSDDDEVRRPSKVSKTNKKSSVESLVGDEVRKSSRNSKASQISAEDKKSEKLLVPKIEPESLSRTTSLRDEPARGESINRSLRKKRQRENSNDSSTSSSGGNRKKSSLRSSKKANIAEEATEVRDNDATIEASMYEDAIGKTIPMNSTMNPNTSMTIDRKMMNVTVVLDTLNMPPRMNETVTITKKSTKNLLGSEDTTIVNENGQYEEHPKSPLESSFSALKTIVSKEPPSIPEYNPLITEDESSSSPEKQKKKKSKKKANTEEKKLKKRFTRSSLMTEDEDSFVPSTPPLIKPVLRDVNTLNLKTLKNIHKPSPLFSPYTKESVRKRVEAFEQVGSTNPTTVEIDAPPRLTRTKTRAMAAAAADNNFVQTGQSVAQKAARKSLSRAKEIAKLKERKEHEETKENVLNSAQKIRNMLNAGEKVILKQQQRVTPVSKSRIQPPMSVNRIQHTPANNQQLTTSKALSATKTNIITSVDSFIQPSKMLTKSKSNDNLAEKIKKVNDVDVRKKKEETLKALSEEKRRKREEKELKNKLAREAKEKLEMERRLKQEKEREEKAKHALMLQEKQREEYEKKRLLQLQRAQEREERRRQEEQLKLMNLQEQEEAEQQLAEQKRREQETERRKLAEARAQQQAAAEAARLKVQYLKSKAAELKFAQDPNSYILDSEPDDEESDDEARPKYPIPHWAQPDIRKTQVAIQQYIPMNAVLAYFGARSSTPDLTELFKGIKKERLQRTSSANWKSPPRFSRMNESFTQ